MSGSTSLDIDETTTKVPKMDIEVTTVKPADINLIQTETKSSLTGTTTPSSTSLLLTDPDDRRFTTTAKTGLFEGTGQVSLRL